MYRPEGTSERCCRKASSMTRTSSYSNRREADDIDIMIGFTMLWLTIVTFVICCIYCVSSRSVVE